MSTRNLNRAAAKLPLRLALAAGVAGLALATAPARAAIEEGYDPSVAPVPSTWYASADPAALQADRDYVAGMRAHHADAPRGRPDDGDGVPGRFAGEQPSAEGPGGGHHPQPGLRDRLA